MTIETMVLNTNETKNKRFYSKETLVNICEQINKKANHLIGYIGFPKQRSLHDASHLIEKAEIRDNELYCTIRILETPQGNKLKTILNEMVFRTEGDGWVDDKQEIKDFNIRSIIAISKDEDALK